MSGKYKLLIISHTHWDREWYQTFQGFRKRLVFMMDHLIEKMEKDPDYKYFHMDGQTIMLEDYLKIRPENEGRLRKLIKDGRIIIGPWYVMPDEFLVSGESLVRNLQKGFAVSKEYDAEPMKNGYVVDIFGHNSQFPQILRGFGIDSALLYRGIGDYPEDAFIWEAVDGSGVLCIKMDRERSYSNFYFAIRWPFDGREYDKEELVSRMKKMIKYSGETAVSDNLLMMDGVDHIEIEPALPQIISILNENIDNIEIKQCTLEEFAKVQMKVAGDRLKTIKGELYNVGQRGINNQVLKNVLSSMVHIKQMNNECEVLLTRWVEPFDTILAHIGGLERNMAGTAQNAGVLARKTKGLDHNISGYSQNSGVLDQNMGGFIDEAWHFLFQNHPHDSICGCSISRVHSDNEYRFNQVKDIGEEVLKHDLGVLVSQIDTSIPGKPGAIVLFNASQKGCKGIVETDVELNPENSNNFRIFDENGAEIPYQILGAKKGSIKGIFNFGRLPEFKPMNIYNIAFQASIPPVGYSTYWFEEYKNIGPERGDYTFKEYHAPYRNKGTMQTGHRTWENEFLKVHINNNGTLNVTNLSTGKEYRELLIFEDCADIGDGWNYKKPLKDSRYLSLNCCADISVENEGPFVTEWKIALTMKLPSGMSHDRTERPNDSTEFKIITLVKLKKGSPVLEFKTLVDNNISEHRLRVLFPSWINTEKFYTSTPFYMQKRDIKKPDTNGYIETETGVFPNQGVILLHDESDSLSIYNKGLYEVEITEDASKTAALTLFRSFRNEIGRDEGEMSYMKRSMAFEYALEFQTGKAGLNDVMESGEFWRTGIKSVCTGSHKGGMNTQASFLKINIPGALLSAMKTGKDGMIVVRLYNCMDNDVEGSVEIFGKPEKAYTLNLNDEIIGVAELKANVAQVQLRAAQILTLGLVM